MTPPIASIAVHRLLNDFIRFEGRPAHDAVGKVVQPFSCNTALKEHHDGHLGTHAASTMDQNVTFGRQAVKGVGHIGVRNMVPTRSDSRGLMFLMGSNIEDERCPTAFAAGNHIGH